MTRRAACGFAGIHRDTIHDWMAKDDEFRKLVEQAEDQAEARYTATIRAAGTGAAGDWRAALAWLERRRSANWREKISVDDAPPPLEDQLAEALEGDDVDARLQALADDAQRRRASRPVRDAPDGESPEAGPGEPR